MKLLFTSILLILFGHIFGQDKTLAFPGNDTLKIKDTILSLDFENSNQGVIRYRKDAELDEIIEFVGKNKSNPENIRIEGYRIQIYFNENKSVALGQKANFLAAYDQHKAYLDYLAPNYRVRVGNFRTKLEAEKLKQDLLANYPTCIIIKDNIELPELELNND